MEEAMITRSAVTAPRPIVTDIVALGPPEIVGTSATDYLYGTGNDDIIRGLDGNDYLYGLAGNDILDGGLGVDVMAGGVGDDVYHVDSVNDVVWEWGGEGIDTVRCFSVVAYTLPTAVENLVLEGISELGA